jgi:hypothetical protein
VIGVWVDDTLWALKRLASSISGDSKGVRGLACLGERALLVVKDDVLVMCAPKATLGGAGQVSEGGTGLRGVGKALNDSLGKGRLCRTTRPRRISLETSN